MRITLLSVLFSTLAFSLTPKDSLEEDPSLLRYRLLESLLKSATKKLDKYPGCTPNVLVSGDNLGKKLAWNISFMEKGKDNSIGPTCKMRKNKRAACDLLFYADSKGDSPWSCGFRFEVTLPDYTIDFSKFSCIGTC